MLLSYRGGGLLLGLVFFMAVFLAKPIGVSTQFVIFDGILWDALVPDTVVVSETARSGHASTNAYLDGNGGRYAKAVANPLNHGFVLVLAMIAGAFLSARLRGGIEPSERTMPSVWRSNFGGSVPFRFAAVFVSGFVVLFGARLAGGCTSGHMMSGMMQTALSGYIFAAGAFLAGIPVALMLFPKED